MCVILEIQPKVEVPYDKLALACDINKHGFGIAYVSNKEIKIRRSIEQPNDPKKVAEILTELAEHKRFVHLRHATVGKVVMENNHPFVSHKQKGRPSIAFMHNGGINTWAPTKNDDVSSDTKCFNDEFVIPLIHRIGAYCQPRDILNDWMFKRFVQHENGTYSSVLVFFDIWGNVLKFNADRGKQFEGWWASNSYSFESTHSRSSSRPTYTHTGSSWAGQQSQVWRKRQHGTKINRPLPWEWEPYTEHAVDLSGWESELIKNSGGVHSDVDRRAPLVPVPGVKMAVHPIFDDTVEYVHDRKAVTDVIKQAKDKAMVDPTTTGRNLKVVRTPFSDIAGCSLDDLKKLGAPELADLCGRYPKIMSQAVLDLLAERSDREEEAKALHTRIRNQAEVVARQATELAAKAVPPSGPVVL